MVPVFFFLFNVFYVGFQSRFIFGGDSAEYSTIARTWGIAHPPGYPLYSLLINILDKTIPFGTTPWKIALLSSIPTILTAYFIYKILSLVKLQKYIALMTSILYLFLFPVWQYALIPEVFGLHTMLISIITYVLLKYSQNQGRSLLACASFVFGLCISNHHIFILFIPGWIVLIKERLKKIYRDKKLLMHMFILMSIGVSFYLYAIIASINNTVLDWENAKTIQGFLKLITRSSYGSFKAYSGSGANIANQLSDMVSGLIFILLDFKPLGIIFIGIGMFASRKYGKQFSQFLFISIAFHFVFLFYTNFVLTASISEGMFERFLIPIYFILILFLGIGVDYLYTKFYLRIVHMIRNIHIKTFARTSFLFFIIAYISLIAVQNYKTISLIPQENTFDQFGKDIISTVPFGGILTTQGDTSTFTSYYHLYGLKERKDLIFFQLGLMGRANYIQMIKKRSPTLVVSTPIKNGKEFESFIADNVKRGYYADHEMSNGTWRPYGLLWKYYPDDLSAASDSAKLLADNKRLWEYTYKIPELSKEEENIFHLKSVDEFYLKGYQNYAKLLVYSEKNAEAEMVLENIAKRYKKNDPQSNAEYMNILVLQKKCGQALRVANTIGLDRAIEKYPGFVKSALFYMQTCDPKNPKNTQYKKKFLEYEKRIKTDLNSF